MSHLDPDQLALLALGEDVATPEELAHLARCVECALDRDRLAKTVGAARIPDVSGPLETPDHRVWTAIAVELELPAGLRDDPSQVTSIRAARSQRPGARRQRRWALPLIAAAVVVLLAGTGAGLLLTRPATRPVATATLLAFPGWTGERGTALLERQPDGARIVAVTTTLRPDDRTDHEVWLLTSDAERLVSLGTLHGTSGSFTVPSTVDLDLFRVVDISAEPRDGDPAHSGDSIVRGALRASA